MLSAAAMCFIAGAAEAAVHEDTITGEASGVFDSTTFTAAADATTKCSPVFAIAGFSDETVLGSDNLG
jgi:hypothetical protein